MDMEDRQHNNTSVRLIDFVCEPHTNFIVFVVFRRMPRPSFQDNSEYKTVTFRKKVGGQEEEGKQGGGVQSVREASVSDSDSDSDSDQGEDSSDH